MNILYVGSGFVGACSAAVSADSGHNVLLFDIDENKIKMLGSGDRDTIESCLFEDGLGDLLIRHKERVSFTTDYRQVENFLDACDAVFLCVATPEINESGESDLTHYNAALGSLSSAMRKRNGGGQEKYVVIVNKSTVPIGLVDDTEKILKNAGAKNFGVASNPEFLVEGKAISGSQKPDRIVVGAWNEKDFSVMRQIYQRFYDSPSTQYIEVNPKEAAAGKLLANFYLFNKLAVCFDVIGRTCETFAGLKFENLRRILSSDERIGNWGLYDSLFAGGSCFIKDARSLAHQLQTAGKNPVLVNETYLANKRQLELFLSRARLDAKREWQGASVAVIGLAFKRDTNDTRNSPSIEIVRHLVEQGAGQIRLYDPSAMAYFKAQFPENTQIRYTNHELEAASGSDIIIIATDWPQFRGLADMLIAEPGKRPLIMDGRRMLQHRYEDLRNAGFEIIAVGSPYMPAKSKV